VTEGTKRSINQMLDTGIGYAWQDTAQIANNETDAFNAHALEQILTNFRTELLKLTPAHRYLTRVEFIEQLISERDIRSNHLDIEFGEPGWDMLIDLLRASERGQNVSVSSLTLASRVPPTTALRQIAHLKSQMLLEIEPDPFDKRRLYVTLSQTARAALNNYLLDLASKRHIVLLTSKITGEAAD
jgi:DNA-binding MarR family transcriptional regulator